MKTPLVLACMLALTAAAPGLASATHNFCHNGESTDVYLGFVGVDGPPLESNGEQVCVGGGDDFYEITFHAPSGTGAALRLCFATDARYDPCTGAGNSEILGYTGVAVFCSGTVCVWIDGTLV